MPATTKKTNNRKNAGKSTRRAAPAPQEQKSGAPGRILGGAVCLLLMLCIAVGYFSTEAVVPGFLRTVLSGLFGYGYWLWALMLLIAGGFLLLHRERKASGRVVCALLTPLLCGGLLHLLLAAKPDLPAEATTLSWLWQSGKAMHSGGVCAGGLAMLGEQYISRAATVILLLAGQCACLFVMLHTTPRQVAEKVRERSAAREAEELHTELTPKTEKAETPVRRRSSIDIPLDDEPVPQPDDENPLRPGKKTFFAGRSRETKTPDEVLQPRQEAAQQPASAPVPEEEVRQTVSATAQEVEQATEEVSREIDEELSQPEGDYQYPPITLLDENRSGNFAEVGAELRGNSKRLSDTLVSFSVDARPGAVVHGPSVTRYEFSLDQGVKLSKITNLADDIALALGVSGVRIAPVPGKISVVGIEVPNKAVTAVRIRDVVESREFAEHPSKTAFSVGVDIGGNKIIGNIGKLPHVLIAGTTGSGKSVCTNSLIVSLLYKSTPEEVRFIMVDPKMVELAPYNGIPHLLIPVVTDPKKAAGALQWAVYEMMKRYKLFSESGVKELSAYNELVEQTAPDENGDKPKKLPTVVVVIDELADLMLVAAKEVEESICRVAQMGRAAGMHLVIATQRPSSDVITGLMKANIPSRIAFAVASSLESRIILDTAGAEKLVGKGDMLYAPLGAGKPKRVQGCFITAEEIQRVVDYVKETGETSYDEKVMEKIEQAMQDKEKKQPAAESAPGDDCDELLPAAVDVILETGQASVSMLQRRLKLGYARAARLVDQMEERGIVGPFEGSKPRQILIDKAKWQEMQMQNAVSEPPIDRDGSIRDVFESHDALE